MKETSSTLDLLIIGAGLTGLTLAYQLRDSGLRIRILEARDRLGGRIHTTSPTAALPPQEMGATWLHSPHRQLLSLLDELGLKRFEQVMGPRAIYEQSQGAAQLVQLPPNQEPSHRIQGGTSALIAALASQLPADWIQLDTKVQSLIDMGDHVQVETADEVYRAKHLVSTLPPNLFLQSISSSSSFPEELLSACAKTHTWMGESIKISVAYRDPFWRKLNTAGTIFSNVGPLTEFYDHAPVEDDTYALMGFMNGALSVLTKAERQQRVIAQLQKFYGPQAADFLAYNEVVWRNEPFTFDPETPGLVPHQNNGHPIFRKAYWDDKLYIGGSETASAHPGYMEGAVASGGWLAGQIKQA
ncbi:MAG: flavin monoamine oxidase family protein [Saprospiraceae bacterium]